MAELDDMMHLLVVDDDTRIRELLSSYLANHEFRVSAAGNASEARAKMKSIAFDLIILDIMMPGESGLELSQSLRDEAEQKNGFRIPILFLSALASAQDRIRGLMAGGDDYLSKPFEPQELLLRIQSILRRQSPKDQMPDDVSFGEFSFNLQRGHLRKGDAIVHLTTRETEMLRILASRLGEPVSRQDLAQQSASKGKTEHTQNTRGVDVQINRLRAKIEDRPTRPIYLQTVRAKGYVLHAHSGV